MILESPDGDLLIVKCFETYHVDPKFEKLLRTRAVTEDGRSVSRDPTEPDQFKVEGSDVIYRRL